MPLTLKTGQAYLLPASTSFALVRPLQRRFLPLVQLNPPTRCVANGEPPTVWPKVTIVNHDRDANAPTNCVRARVVEISPGLAARCRYRGEMMLIDSRVCVVFVDPDYVCRYAQAVP